MNKESIIKFKIIASKDNNVIKIWVRWEIIDNIQNNAQIDKNDRGIESIAIGKDFIFGLQDRHFYIKLQ